MNMYHSCKQMTKYCTANSQRYCHVQHWTNSKKGIHVCCYMYQRKLNWYCSWCTLVTNDEYYITTDVCHFFLSQNNFLRAFLLVWWKYCTMLVRFYTRYICKSYQIHCTEYSSLLEILRIDECKGNLLSLFLEIKKKLI